MDKGIKKKVFISYSRSDKPRIKGLVKTLEAEGIDVWWDVETPPGKRFADVIYEALQTADYIIVAWSNDSVQSEWVRREAEVGLERKVLLPILLDDSLSLPFLFRDLHACNFITWQGDRTFIEYKNLIEAIKQDNGAIDITNKSPRKRPSDVDVKTSNKTAQEPAPELSPSPQVTPKPATKPEKTPYKFMLLFVAIAALLGFPISSGVVDGLFTEETRAPVPQGSKDPASPKPTLSSVVYTPRIVEAKPALILRKSPHLNSTGMDSVNYGELLLVRERASARQTVNGKTGYWVKATKTGRNTWYAFDGYLGYYPIYRVVANSGLTIREGPTVNSKKLSKLENRTRVYSLAVQDQRDSVGGITGHWHKVHTGHIEGYMFGAYLTKEN